ncbi:unnamed protein product [Durusdinium trenchii]|uniref:NAD(+) kinase n=1 Tax=Durusdinium trenchii TaxID=1381693 RepID=A0ABP0L4N9_9DINO
MVSLPPEIVRNHSETLSPKQGWREVLVQSNKEMIQEMLASAASGQTARSIDDIAIAVAEKMMSTGIATQLLEESSGALSPMVKYASTETAEKGPQLTDIQAAHWDIWSGKVDDASKVDQLLEQRKLSKSSPHGGSNEMLVLVEEGDCPDHGSCTSEEERNRMQAGLELRTTTQQYTWMRWKEKPTSVLLVAKQGDVEVTRRLRDIASWVDSQGCFVILEPDLWAEVQGKPPPEFSPPKRKQTKEASNKWRWGDGQGLVPGFAERVRTWTPGKDKLEESIDLVVCVGGDGTLCWASGLFSRAMPPVISFAAGSLGFLTPFPVSDWLKVLMPVLGAKCEVHPLQVACRMRFQMRLTRQDEETPEDPKPIPVQAMNEVLVHRGSSPHLVKLEVFVNDKLVTMVQGDGLIIATPTGSTAYSLAAGGSMMHPAVPGIILTPVCPHSLSFRPVVLPDSAVVKVQVPLSSRSSRVMVAVDGKDRIELKRGDFIEVEVSQYPIPTVCKSSVTADWFRSVNEALQWNLRLEQKKA